ncbi:MAG: RidA family protein [Oscillospiraceae bacterium]|nr:RidA family protein [Oscillospiraceae bacterium]
MRIVETKQAPAAIGPYSQAVIVGNLVYTSGQIPLCPNSMEMVGSNVAEQTEQVIANLKAVLAAAGSNIIKVFKTTCFLTGMGDFSAFNEVYARHFAQKPARSCVAAAALPKGALVEIEVIAEI